MCEGTLGRTLNRLHTVCTALLRAGLQAVRGAGGPLLPGLLPRPRHHPAGAVRQALPVPGGAGWLPLAFTLSALAASFWRLTAADCEVLPTYTTRYLQLASVPSCNPLPHAAPSPPLCLPPSCMQAVSFASQRFTLVGTFFNVTQSSVNS